jgi:hypothetical protein
MDTLKLKTYWSFFENNSPVSFCNIALRVAQLVGDKLIRVLKGAAVT